MVRVVHIDIFYMVDLQICDSKVEFSTNTQSSCFRKTKYSPNSVHTVGVLAVTLGLAVWCGGNLDVYDGQLLCTGALLGACCLAPVQTKHSVAPLSGEKHNGFSTLCPSAQKVVLVALGVPQMPSEDSWMPLQSSLEVPPKPFLGSFFQNSPSRIPPLRFLLKESFLRIPLPGFHLKDSFFKIPARVASRVLHKYCFFQLFGVSRRSHFKSHFGLGKTLKNQFWTPKLIFQCFDLPMFSVFVQNSLFESQISRSIL